MKTTSFIIAVLLFSSGIILAQNDKKPMKVRVKKVENFNGVERITDTTYTTTDYISMKDLPKDIEMIKGIDSLEKEDIVQTFKVQSAQMLELENMDWIGIESGNGAEKSQSQKVIIMECDDSNGENTKQSPKKNTKVIIIRHIEVLDLTNEELKLIGKNGKDQSASLDIKDLSLAPNPSSGSLEISLFLPKKGLTTISVYNLEGKLIHEEKLNDFTGRYQKQLDLSSNPKGIYFLNVSQNKESITKKLILE